MSGMWKRAKPAGTCPLDGRARPHCSPDKDTKPDEETKPDADSKCASEPPRQQWIRMEALTSNSIRNASEEAGDELTCGRKKRRC
jgi:hypothetical protein